MGKEGFRLPRGYWNPKTELMSRKELEELQLRKLKYHLNYVWERSPFYRNKMERAGITPDDIKSLEDYYERFPLMTREEIGETQLARPLFGQIAALPWETAMRYHQTSGTSGKPPLRTFDTPKDWSWISEMWAYALYGFGVRPYDRLMIAFGYGMFIGFWGLHYAAEKIGCMTLPSAPFDSETRIRVIRDLKITALACTPTYALRLATTSEEMGIDLTKDTDVRIIITSGEPRPDTTKRAIERAWGARVGDTAGMTEAGTIFTFECAEEPGGTHIIEDNFIEEVIDPETMRHTEYGQKGVRVMTSLGREGFPILRYWSNDLVIRLPHDTCPCGRGFDIYKECIVGRYDDMRKVRGVWFMPVMIEDVVRSFPEVDEFQAILDRYKEMDRLTVKVEFKGTVPQERHEELRRRIGEEAKRILSFSIDVEVVPPGTLPRFEMKAKRFVDLTR